MTIGLAGSFTFDGEKMKDRFWLLRCGLKTQVVEPSC